MSVSFRCPVDDTVMDIPTADKRMQKFKLEAFSFIGDHPFVYMHCKVLICNATDPNSRCAQGCVNRAKRSLMTQGSKNEEVHLSQGPFMRGDDEKDKEETKLEETEKDMRDTEKSGKFNDTGFIRSISRVLYLIFCIKKLSCVILYSAGMFPTLVAAMAVVAAVCVVGVSYFAWASKKRRVVRDYQLLTVAAED